MMASLWNMFTGGASKKKEERKRYGPNLGIPSPTSSTKSPTSPSYPPSSPGPATTQRQPSVSQPKGTYPNWEGSSSAEPTPQPAPPPISPPNTQDDEQFAWFTAIDQDGSGQVSAEELQSALISGYGGKRFSTETVKYLMSVFDLDGSGGIGIDEFKPLWDYVKQWREMFESFDDNQDGIIDAVELSNALKYYNLQVGPLVINFLIHKYGALRISLPCVTSNTRTLNRDVAAWPQRRAADRTGSLCLCMRSRATDVCALRPLRSWPSH
jgi:Ca2+-binding EF-hand superfamily protein